MSLSQPIVESSYLTVTYKLNLHIHKNQQVAPWGSGPVLLTSGAGAYNFGAYSNDIIAAGVTTNLFDLHWAIISAASANGNFEIEFYYGAGDTPVCRVDFSRTSPFTASVTLPLMTIQMPAGSRIRARSRDSIGASTCEVKVLFHEYS